MKSGERFNDKRKRKRKRKPENHLLFNENENIKNHYHYYKSTKTSQKYQNRLYNDIIMSKMMCLILYNNFSYD